MIRREKLPSPVALFFSTIYFLHFIAIGFAWIPMTTHLRAAVGVRECSLVICALAVATLCVFGLFAIFDRLGWRINYLVLLVFTELGLAVGYYFLAKGLYGGYFARVPLYRVVLCYFSVGLLQTSFFTALQHLTLDHPQQKRQFPRHRAVGSLGYIVAGCALSVWISDESGLMWAAVTVAVCGVFVLLGMPWVLTKHGQAKTQPASGSLEEANSAVKLMGTTSHRHSLFALFAVYLLAAISESIYGLYAHELATRSFGSLGVMLIAVGVVLEIVILLLIPKVPASVAEWLIPLGPVAWMVALLGCTAAVQIAPFFAFAMILQGVNCPFQAMVNVGIKKQLPKISAQAGLTAAQSAGALLGHGINFWLPGTDYVIRWQWGLACSFLALVLIIVDAVLVARGRLLAKHAAR